MATCGALLRAECGLVCCHVSRLWMQLQVPWLRCRDVGGLEHQRELRQSDVHAEPQRA